MKKEKQIKEMFLYGMYATDFFGEMTRLSDIRVTDRAPFISALVSEAFEVARGSSGNIVNGWEGDVRMEDGKEEIYIFSLPAPESTEYGVCWKHDNNGDTFVYSPLRLPWLDAYLMEGQPCPTL